MGYAVGRKYCNHEGCGEYFLLHRSGTIEAFKAGWFHQKVGTAWCPDHIPEWVSGWCAGKGKS